MFFSLLATATDSNRKRSFSVTSAKDSYTDSGVISTGDQTVDETVLGSADASSAKPRNHPDVAEAQIR